MDHPTLYDGSESVVRAYNQVSDHFSVKRRKAGVLPIADRIELRRRLAPEQETKRL